MKVIATSKGFYDNRRRREGEVFLLKPIQGKKVAIDGKTITEHLFTPEEQFSSVWMKRADGTAVEGQVISSKGKVKAKAKSVGDLSVI